MIRGQASADNYSSTEKRLEQCFLLTFILTDTQTRQMRLTLVQPTGLYSRTCFTEDYLPPLPKLPPPAFFLREDKHGRVERLAICPVRFHRTAALDPVHSSGRSQTRKLIVVSMQVRPRIFTSQRWLSMTTLCQLAHMLIPETFLTKDFAVTRRIFFPNLIISPIHHK